MTARGRFGDLPARLATGGALAVVALAAWALGFRGIVALLVVVTVVAAREVYAVMERSGLRPATGIGLVAGMLAVPAAVWAGAGGVATVLVLEGIASLVQSVVTHRAKHALLDTGLTVSVTAWIGGTLCFAVPLARTPALLLAAVVATSVLDTAQYAGGRAWGRRLLAPRLSAAKTVEGVVAGIACTLLVAFPLSLMEPFELPGALMSCLAIGVAGIAGDLAESAVKRRLGVKDMSSALKGHGGVMDLIDGFLFVAPVSWLMFRSLGYLA